MYSMLLPFRANLVSQSRRIPHIIRPTYTAKLPSPLSLLSGRPFHASAYLAKTLNQATRSKKPIFKKVPKAPLLEGCPQKKGVISLIKTIPPKKPNSAKRKICRVKLTTGKSCFAYIPGEGHNLQEHSVVLIRGGRAQDLPGVR